VASLISEAALIASGLRTAVPERSCRSKLEPAVARDVEIIAGRDPHAHLADASNPVIANSRVAVRARQVPDGLLSAIDWCGATLKTHYPEIPSG
jgi:hypothetical protein